MPKSKENAKLTSIFQSIFNYSVILLAISVGLFIIFLLGGFATKILSNNKQNISKQTQEYVNQVNTLFPSPTPIIYQQQNQQEAQTVDDGEPWGVAKQVGPHTYTMKVGQDSTISTPQEAFNALNEYRYKNSREKLNWSDNLAVYARSRSDFYNSKGDTDAHTGFIDFLDNQDGFQKLGFNQLGENGSYGYRLNGVHLIEWMYASDEGHNANQLSSDWSHVGIGITDTSTNFIFGGN